MVIKKNTIVEKYKIKNFTVFVKREDLCTKPPGPPFSKCRGLYAHMLQLKNKGIETVGYAESAISMAGWGVAWAAAALNMRAVLFDPQYTKTTPELLQLHRIKWREFGATIVPVPAGRTSVNYHIGKKMLTKLYGPKAIMLPIGIRLPETVIETCKEAQRTFRKVKPKSIVICVGSGTITAGILKAAKNTSMIIYGVCCHQCSIITKRNEIYKKAHMPTNPLFKKNKQLQIIDVGWSYNESASIEEPFPCHPFYDLKAWKWLDDNINKIPKPILFWNIGSQPVI